jgi:hypothetical protein
MNLRVYLRSDESDIEMGGPIEVLKIKNFEYGRNHKTKYLR